MYLTRKFKYILPAAGVSLAAVGVALADRSTDIKVESSPSTRSELAPAEQSTEVKVNGQTVPVPSVGNATVPVPGGRATVTTNGTSQTTTVESNVQDDAKNVDVTVETQSSGKYPEFF
jgi:hypothetical protein